ncbi:hypothetical protein HFP89_13180 [Wenzhouxiangella sp. XN79A]|uniref:ATP-grasp domain-containing protein n=1 Tax=Wenzhouxiangella sp. XN79A TaxID=2724193 RepID=UPI00144A87FB|nr:hypothetical protein [Wenzhouxiangella sp. XN79A]NKI36117.1 hypothetical protein [Wenzhouxiangella sp. XN79A]
MPRIALVNDDRWVDPVERTAYVTNILTEDGLLERAFEALGARPERVAWSDPGIDWTRFDALLIRQTWDYFERFAEFRAWLDRIDGAVHVVNPVEVIRWNADKRYLVDLAEAGVAAVPTRVVERGDGDGSLAGRMEAAGWNEVVIKPAVSGAGRETYRIARADAAAREALWQARVAAEDMLIQPFAPAIVDSGEVSLVVIDGQATHAVRKIAAEGEFRVQDDHGGTVHPHAPTAAECALAERAISCAARRTGREIAYARVDLVDAPDGPQVMELELIEPELFLRQHPPAAERLAQAVLSGVG